MVTPATGWGSSLYAGDSHWRKNINPIQVINVNLGFRQKSYIVIEKGVKFEFNTLH